MVTEKEGIPWNLAGVAWLGGSQKAGLAVTGMACGPWRGGVYVRSSWGHFEPPCEMWMLQPTEHGSRGRLERFSTSQSGRDAYRSRTASCTRLSLARHLPRRGYESARSFTIRTVKQRLFGGRNRRRRCETQQRRLRAGRPAGVWRRSPGPRERRYRTQPRAAQPPSCGCSGRRRSRPTRARSGRRATLASSACLR